MTYIICLTPAGSPTARRGGSTLLEKGFGQHVTIEYKTGGGGALGWREFVKTKPDGYTLAGFNIPHVILQPLQQNVGYETGQILPVVLFHSTPLALAVPRNSPYRTAKDLIEFAKKNPGAVTIGGSALFSGYHMAALRLEKLTGTRITYVPFTGSAPQMTAFLNGHLTAAFAASDDVTRNRGGRDARPRLRHRGALLQVPQGPDAEEQGIDLVEGVDRGVAVPEGTPADVIRKIESVFLSLSRSREFRGSADEGRSSSPWPWGTTSRRPT